jgi:hypothetical protein
MHMRRFTRNWIKMFSSEFLISPALESWADAERQDKRGSR